MHNNQSHFSSAVLIKYVCYMLVQYRCRSVHPLKLKQISIACGRSVCGVHVQRYTTLHYMYTASYFGEGTTAPSPEPALTGLSDYTRQGLGIL